MPPFVRPSHALRHALRIAVRRQGRTSLPPGGYPEQRHRLENHLGMPRIGPAVPLAPPR